VPLDRERTRPQLPTVQAPLISQIGGRSPERRDAVPQLSFPQDQPASAT
jgi:hypothetical protein